MYVFTYIFTLFSGEFGIVYKARLSKGFNRPYSEVVAVKTLKGVYVMRYYLVHYINWRAKCEVSPLFSIHVV